MRFQKLISPAALLLTGLVLLKSPSITGQVLQPNPSLQESQNQPSADEPDRANHEKTSDEDKPFELSSRFHLQEGTSTGYLIVKLELPQGSYIYSMAQKAPLRPSKIQVIRSGQFRIKGNFMPDRPAIVVENDPVFQQRLEKHTDVIQFFAPIEIAPDADPVALSAEMTFSGQVCNDRGFCVPIMATKTKAKFAGYFERSAEKRANAQSKSPIGNQLR